MLLEDLGSNLLIIKIQLKSEKIVAHFVHFVYFWSHQSDLFLRLTNSLHTPFDRGGSGEHFNEIPE